MSYNMIIRQRIRPSAQFLKFSISSHPRYYASPRISPRRPAKPQSSSPKPDDVVGEATGAVVPTPNSPISDRGEASPPPSISSALAAVDPSHNNLLAPVHIPEDTNAVIKSSHPATSILAQSGLVVQRQMEMLNIFLGFEQANRYIIMDPQGQHVGYLAEHDGGIGRAMGRQFFRTHRAFTSNVFDRAGKEVLRFHRPFSYINSTIRVYDALEAFASMKITTSSSTDLATAREIPSDPEAARRLSSIPLSAMRIIGEAHSQWAPLRRKYDLYLAHNPSRSDPTMTPSISETPDFTQFAYIDEPFLSWDFSLRAADKSLIGSVNRNFAGFAREIFTDTGVYALRMDSAGLADESEKSHVVSQTHKAYESVLGEGRTGVGMTLDQRAVMLATAVTVDYDYFSRLSRQSGGMWFMPMWMGGAGEAGAGGAAGGVAGGAAEAGAIGGAAEAGAGSVVGQAGRAVGGAAAGEGAIAGAGTLAGYEAMQRSMGRSEGGGQSGGDVTGGMGAGQHADSQSPEQSPMGDFEEDRGETGAGETWGSGENDPWSGDQSDAGGDGGGGGGDGEGGGIIGKLWDMFGGD